MGGHILVIASFVAIIFALTTASDPSPLQDFCVFDPTSSVIINGQACMDPKLVNASHFSFSGLVEPASITNPLGFGVTVAQIPGLNTLGLSMARADFEQGGTVPPHSHPRATEVLTILEGKLRVGFVTSNPENRLITKVLKKGDVFVFPLGTFHFQQNVGNGRTSLVAAFSSQNIGTNLVPNILFASNPPIPEDILTKSLQVDESVIRELRR